MKGRTLDQFCGLSSSDGRKTPSSMVDSLNRASRWKVGNLSSLPTIEKVPRRFTRELNRVLICSASG